MQTIKTCPVARPQPARKILEAYFTHGGGAVAQGRNIEVYLNTPSVGPGSMARQPRPANTSAIRPPA
jgi:hypothetical protein